VGLIEALGSGPVALDTALFMYWIEEAQPYLDLISPIFKAVNDGAVEIVSSALTLLEVMVVPYRTGRLDLSDRYEEVLTRSRNLSLIEIDRAQLRAAAQLRAVYSLRTPDALQIAAALSERCTAFLTNDRRLPSIAGLRIVQLSDYL
jgi:predicted nucleic acid-binding protein